MTVVIDSSAVLAILKDEPGADLAIARARGAELSAVNLVEVRSKLMDVVDDVDAAMTTLARLEIEIAPFTAVQARLAADLWQVVKGLGISLADRACLALALDRKAQLVTADRDWAKLHLGIDLVMIR